MISNSVLISGDAYASPDDASSDAIISVLMRVVTQVTRFCAHTCARAHLCGIILYTSYVSLTSPVKKIIIKTAGYEVTLRVTQFVSSSEASFVGGAV